uniref:Nematode cuticle collagen N-terminal domain-containing protein n=1 Tax=Trichuris muris TaxID=70415 RepID=A0A5S6Q935_TRIMR
MVSFKQEFAIYDYFAPLIVFFVFFFAVFLISFTCIIWYCVTDTERVEAMQKWKQCQPPNACKRIAAKRFVPPKPIGTQPPRR